jgi:hypothetical protein
MSVSILYGTMLSVTRSSVASSSALTSSSNAMTEMSSDARRQEYSEAPLGEAGSEHGAAAIGTDGLTGDVVGFIAG